MNFKKILIIIFVLLVSCKPKDSEISIIENPIVYSNKGFALIFNEDLLKKKLVEKEIDDRSLIIFNEKLSKDTPVKITNILNGKNLIAIVGDDSNYPLFYNSVISDRIAKVLEINPMEPYIQISSINNNSAFIANKAKTFKEEKKVANKAPVENITIKNIGISKSKKIVKSTKKSVEFNYIIKFADLYFEDSAILLKKRLNDEFNIKGVIVNKISNNQYRVLKGPFKNLDTMINEFNDINKLNFENIEFIKYE